MITLVLGLVVFFAAHLAPTFPEAHARAVAAFGEGPYKGLFSVISAVGLGLIVVGVSATRGGPADPQLWSPPLWTKHIAIVLMLLAFIQLVAAYVPSHIRDWVKHPMLSAVKTWALAHLIANGDLLALILFGSLMIYAGYDRFSVKWRAVPLRPAATGWTGDAICVGVGALAWAAVLFVIHPYLGAAILTR